MAERKQILIGLKREIVCFTGVLSTNGQEPLQFFASHIGNHYNYKDYQNNAKYR